MTREEAINRLKNTAWLGTNKDREETEQAIDMAIEALSADSVVPYEEYRKLLYSRYPDELVRCKDCKWYMLTDHNETAVCTNKQWDISMAVYPIISADDFCSYGERREE